MDERGVGDEEEMLQKCFNLCRFPYAQSGNVCHGFLRDSTNRMQDLGMICKIVYDTDNGRYLYTGSGGEFFSCRKHPLPVYRLHLFYDPLTNLFSFR